METEFKDWEKIKSFVREYGVSIHKPDVAKGFLEDYDQEHSQLSKVFGSWVELYTEIIQKLLRVHPDMKLKDLLDDQGNYMTIEDISDLKEYLKTDEVNLIIGEQDSEMIERLKEITKKSTPDLPRNK